jgi:poly-gamma-glutamate synthesis protein (capsule biosynthesis protein)
MSKHFSINLTGQSLIKYDIRRESPKAFEAIRALLSDADVAFTNFEGTIQGRHGGWPLKGSYFGASDPVVLDALREIGINSLSLSNNHAFDLGPSGVLSTMEEVEARGFLHAGLGANRWEAGTAGVKEISGRRIALIAMDGGPGPDIMYASDADAGRPARPGVNRLRLSQRISVDQRRFFELQDLRDTIGYTWIDLLNDSQPDDPIPLVEDHEVAIGRTVFRKSNGFGRDVKVDPLDLGRQMTAIADAVEDGCLVIAYLHHHHWASDWYKVPDWVSGVAKQCIDAGAAIFASHGAPVLQPIEIYRGRPIFYSLGNFIFHVHSENSNWTASEVWESVVATCVFDDRNHLDAIRLHPVILGGDERLTDPRLEQRLVPERATGAAAARILQRLADQCAALGTDLQINGDTGIIRCDAGRIASPQALRTSA